MGETASAAAAGRTPWPVIGTYVAATVGMLALPLVNVLHAESSAILAAVAFFAGGLDSVARFRAREGVRNVLRWEMSALLVPLALYQIARLVVPGCDLFAGLRYFILFPVVSLLLGVALAYLLTAARPEKAGGRFVLIAVVTTLGTLIWDLALHPQFYVYNHVFGGVLGPIYDLHHASRPGLYVFRGMTLLWAALFFSVGFKIRHPHRRRLPDAITTTLFAALAIGYGFGPQLGINTTHGTIADGLGGTRGTEHFIIHYDPRVLSEPEIERIAEDHEYRYDMMAQELGFLVDEPILTYVYPTASVRASLTGAGFTNIAPVWLRQPQIHILYDAFDRSFAHELAHVFSRDMGLPVLNASLRVGLVEGFAVAMEPPIGLPSATDQVAAIRNAPVFDSLYAGQSLASAVVASLSPAGFWSGRGAASYTTMGSFVRYLLDTYGPDPFREVYGMASFESTYGVRLTDLAEGWEASLLGRQLPPEVAMLAASRFSVLSIFERRCPHDTPPAVELYWDALDFMQLRDSSRAREAVDKVLKLRPGFAPALSLWANLELQRGDAEGVANRLNPVLSADTSLAGYVGMQMADALAMKRLPEGAAQWYDRSILLQSPYSRSLLAILNLRSALVEYPDLVGAINDVGGRKAARARLTHSDIAAARIMGALAAALDDDYDQARSTLEGTAGTQAADLTGPRWLAWAASFAYRDGQYEEAERFRTLAVQAAHTADDRYEVERLGDFGKRIQWARGRTP